MREFVFTSKLFQGNITFGYNEEDILTKFINEAELNDVQLKYLSENFPFTASDLQKIVGTHGKIQEIIDVSFEKFWVMFDKKVNRKRSEELWYKLSESDRQLCLDRLNKYKIFCKQHNRFQKDPDTYLRNRSWIDELK